MSTIKRSITHPLIALEGNQVFAANGNLILGYQVELPEVYSLSESDFEALHQNWFQAFKSLPSGSIVHKQDVYQKANFDAGDLPSAKNTSGKSALSFVSFSLYDQRK
jgi:conjugal transfer ATP-binding protein TraC